MLETQDKKVDPHGLAVQIASKRKYIQTNFLSEKGASLKYARYRLLRPVLKIYKKWLLKGQNEIPWLTPAAIEIIDSLLTKDMLGLEYGSGSSTKYFAKRLRSLTSVEHHADWYQQVKKWLSDGNITNITYQLIPGSVSESNLDIEKRNRSPFVSENTTYQDYYEFIESFPDEHFDFILIDGRARTECTKRAIAKTKSGGMIILDNSERLRYLPVHDLLKDWQKVNTTSGITDSTFWFKP